jgi:hypothetical protein
VRRWARFLAEIELPIKMEATGGENRDSTRRPNRYYWDRKKIKCEIVMKSSFVKEETLGNQMLECMPFLEL